MYDRLKKLYNNGRITESGLDFWVSKNLITADQKKDIVQGNISIGPDAEPCSSCDLNIKLNKAKK